MHAHDERPILVVEDDRTSAELVRLYLVRDGHNVVVANDGAQGLKLARETPPRLIVLDLMLPQINGFELCRTIRAESDVPIIMVTARIDEDDRLAGLDLGADDYLPKPFSPRELAARVRAVLRRTARQAADPELETIIRGDVEVDLDGREARVAQKLLQLTPTEFRILAHLARSAGRVISREQIISAVFGYDFDGFERTVDTHVSNLRRKLEATGHGHRYINTVYGMGYRFDAA